MPPEAFRKRPLPDTPSPGPQPHMDADVGRLTGHDRRDEWLSPLRLGRRSGGSREVQGLHSGGTNSSRLNKSRVFAILCLRGFS